MKLARTPQESLPITRRFPEMISVTLDTGFSQKAAKELEVPMNAE
jgi:hypothetical protein